MDEVNVSPPADKCEREGENLAGNGSEAADPPTSAAPFQRWATVAALLLLVLLGFWVRYRIWLVFGGAEKSYVLWAREHYFGGIAPFYLDGAERLLRGEGWRTTVYPPGYALVIAGWELVGINSPQRIRLAQSGLDALAVFPLYYIARKVGVGRVLAIGAGAVYALSPSFGFGSTMILAEALSPILLTSVMVLLLWADGRQSPYAWAPAGLTIAVSALVRPDLILLIGPVLFWVTCRSGKGRRLLSVVTLAASFAVPMVVYGSYNHAVNGKVAVTSQAGFYNLWSGLGTRPNNFGYIVSDVNAGRILSEKGLAPHTAEAEAFWRQEYLTAWRQQPSFVLSTIAWRIRRMPVDTVESIYSSIYMERLSEYYGLKGVIALMVTTILLWRRRHFARWMVISFPLGYALASLGLVYYEPRYIRYVALSYILAGVVIAQSVWNSRRASSWLALVRIRRELFVGIVVVAGSLYGARELAQLEAAAHLATVRVSADALFNGGKGRDVVRTDQLEWVPQVPTVQLSKGAEGSLEIVTSTERSAYQVAAAIPVAGLAAISVRYSLEVMGGQIGIGVLSRDESRFLAIKVLPGTGHHEGSLSAAVEGGSRQTKVVVMNARPEDGVSRFKLETLEVRGLD